MIRHRHLRELKYCNKGARDFFVRHNLDWSEFMKNGLPEEVFLATGDEMAIALVKHAREDNDE